MKFGVPFLIEIVKNSGKTMGASKLTKTLGGGKMGLNAQIKIGESGRSV